MLRVGDSLITFTDGVTEARSRIDCDLSGNDRFRGLIAGLGDMSAARMGEAIQQATLSFSGGKISDDTVALVLMVPWRETSGQPGRWAPGARRGHGSSGRPAKMFLMLTTAATVALVVAGTGASAPWFFAVLRRLGLRLRFAPA